MRKIRLFCAAGMSTSLLVTRMQEYADRIGYACEIAAFPVSECREHGTEADIVLLGPQVRFEMNNVKKQLPDKIVEPIDMRSYGLVDGKAVVEHVKKVLGD